MFDYEIKTKKNLFYLNNNIYNNKTGLIIIIIQLRFIRKKKIKFSAIYIK